MQVLHSIGYIINTVFIPNIDDGNSIELLFYLIMYCIFAIALYFAWSRSRQVKTEITELNKCFDLEQNNGGYVLEKTIREIERKINALNCFKDEWREFRESLRKVSKINEEELTDQSYYLNTLDSSHFFDSDHYLARKLYSQYLDIVPGILTGLGLLGTFVGIVYGLSEIKIDKLLEIKSSAPAIIKVIGQEIDPENTATDQQQQLERLFSGIKTCFKTSALGITLSLLVSARLARLYRKSEADYHEKIVSYIDSYFKRHTEADSLHQLIEVNKDLKDSITDTLIKISSEIPARMAEALAPSFNQGFDNVVNSVGQLHQSIGDLTHNTGKQIGDGLNETIDVMVKKLNESTTGNLEKVSNSLEDLVKDIRTILGKTEEMGSKLNERINETAQIEEKMKGIYQLVREGQEQGLVVNKELASISETIKSFSSDLGQKQIEFSKNLNSSASSIDGASKTIKEMGEAITEISSNIVTMAQKIDPVISKAENSAMITERTIENFIKNTSKINQSIDGLGNQADQLHQYTVKMANTLSPLQEITKNFEQSSVNLGQAASKFNNIQEVITSLDTIGSKAVIYAEELRKASESSKISSMTLEEGNKKVAISLSEVTSGFKETIDGFFNVIRQVSSEYDKHMSTAVSSLNSAVSDMGDNLQDMTDRVQETLDQLKKQ